VKKRDYVATVRLENQGSETKRVAYKSMRTRLAHNKSTLLVMILMNVQYCSSDASVTPARYLINQDKAYCVALKQVVDLLLVTIRSFAHRT
jgi:hypothetical protein